MNLNNTPIGANKKFLVTMDGSPFAGFDERKDAEGYINMMKTCKKGGSGQVLAACANHNWEIKER